MEAATLAVIIGAVSGSQVLTTLIQKYFEQQKTSAEATKIDADASKTEIEATSMLLQNVFTWEKSLTNRIVALEIQLRTKDKIIDELKTKLSDLEKDIIKLKHIDPCKSSS